MKFASWVFATVLLLVTVSVVDAQTPAPAPAPAPPASIEQVPPPTPAPTPQPQPEPAPPATPPRREEPAPAPTPAPAGDPPPPAPAPSPLATRVSTALTALRGQGPMLAQITQRDQTIAQLRSENATHQTAITSHLATISNQQAQLAQFRADHATLEASLRAMESERSTVDDTVASLGFDRTRLPSGGSLEDVAENTVEGLQDQLKNETDSEKRGVLALRIMEIRDAKK